MATTSWGRQGLLLRPTPPPVRRHFTRQQCRKSSSRGWSNLPPAALAASASASDLFLLELADKLEDSAQLRASSPLRALREASAEVAVRCRWPSSKDEAYRFTDVKFLKELDIRPVSAPTTVEQRLEVEEDGPDDIRLVFVDGQFSAELSSKGAVPPGVFIGSAAAASGEMVEEYVLPRISQGTEVLDKDVFGALNGIGALDLGLVVVPKNLELEKTVRVVYCSTKAAEEVGAISMSNPRLLVIAEEGSKMKLVEEFVGSESGVYWTNSVCEIFAQPGASVSHSSIQSQGRGSVNVKRTYISQAENSSYKLVEVELGGRLSRHNLLVQQQGSDTSTEMSTFLLCGHDQVHDLHSKLVLSHPRGNARQLHKSIVTASTGHAVFDGNIQVNRYAQQTDAGQLSRCLLLAPRATVNVKPNLQIVADDVKCSHGAAISDLEDEQLFYFQARGISASAARSALIFSFGAEVLQKLEDVKTRRRVEALVRTTLASEGAVLAE